MKKFFTFFIACMASMEFTFATISISQADGWLESAFVKWTSLNDDSDFNVYVRPEGGIYVRLDKPLLRKYDSYYRADALGLPAGKYQLKIVPIRDETEVTSEATETELLTVRAHDRNGFAHYNWNEGVGAYNDDGNLKGGTIILYVCKGNAKTITADIQVNDPNKYPKTTLTGLQTIIAGYQKGYETHPLDVRIIGLLEASDMDELGSSVYGAQIKGNLKRKHDVNITIEGVGDDAVIRGFGFLVRQTKSFEMRNFAIMSSMDDCVSLDTDNSNIWLHHLDLFYGKEGSDSDEKKGDGAIDMKSDSKFVTISYNHFWDTGKSNMCGLSETGPNYITYHHNWYDHSDSRHPRVRTMSVHVYNNFFDGVAKYCVGSCKGSSVFVENNYFKNCSHPMLISMQGTDTKNGTDESNSPTFSKEDGGIIKAFNNVVTGTRPAEISYYDVVNNPIHFDAYMAQTRDEQIPSNVTALKGGSVYDNFDTDPALMPAITPDNPNKIPEIVTSAYGAGRMFHGDFNYSLENQDPNSSDLNTELANLITNYESSLIEILGFDRTDNFQLTVFSSPDEGGSVSGSGIYIYNSLVEISAKPNDGYHFTKWSDGNTDNPRIIVLTKDTAFKAIFSKYIYTLHTIAEHGTIIVSDITSQESDPTGIEQVQLPDVPFEFDFKATDFDATTATIANHPNANLADYQMKLTNNVPMLNDSCLSITSMCKGYINKWSFESTSSGQYFDRKSGDNMTIICKVAPKTGGEAYDIVINRGTTNSADNYNYMFRVGDQNSCYLHTAYRYSSSRAVTLDSNSPQTIVCRVNANGNYILLENKSTGVRKQVSEINWGGTYNTTFRFFYGLEKEHFRGDFYWVYYSFDYLSDEEVQQVIDYHNSVHIVPLDTISLDTCQYEYESILHLSAVPDNGYHFTQWSDGSTDNPRTFTLTQDTTFTAEFALNKYAISVTCDELFGSIDGESGEFDYLTEKTYSAIANDGYHFTQWSDGVKDNPRTIILTQDTILSAEFAKNTYTIVDNSNLSQGYIEGIGTYEYLDEIILTAVAEYGNHFTQWSDGVKDNPRTIILTQDTTFTAEFAIDKSGVCGKDNALTWSYDDQSMSLSISGNGTLDDNYTYGPEAQTQMRKLILGNEISVIGENAFNGSNRLIKIYLGEAIETIGNYAFKNCPYILEIHAPMEFPPIIDTSVFEGCGDLSGIDCYVQEESLAFYRKTPVWKEFNLQVESIPTGFDQITNDSSLITHKILRNGQILILRGEKVYTVTGQEVK